MKLLADENIPQAIVEALRTAGHSVVRAGKRSDDSALLERAKRGGFLLLTFDKEFGIMALQETVPPTCGVILVKMPRVSSAFMAALLVQALDARSDWNGSLAVIETRRVRVRPLNVEGSP